MPELPEVESARVVVQILALNREIIAVDDVDEYVCRPHTAAQFRAALLGKRLVRAHRRGKLLWCAISAAVGDAEDHPRLGLHLGMGGRLVVTNAAGAVVRDGDSTHGLAGPHQPRWDRFTLRFADGQALRLVDKRRLGRAVLDPDLDALGPDALQVSLADFEWVLSRGRVAVKARLLDQTALAGVGNLLADELLWQSRISPRTPVNELTGRQRKTLHRQLRSVLALAVRANGAHTGQIVPHRHPEGHCPRCGSLMRHAVVGGRSTWWCPQDQA